jgi:Family of unknown function (DUF6151)
MTPTDIDVRCRCGTLRGKALGVSTETGSRAICYCRDCQAFARFLGTPGILDAQGGSEVFQLTHSQLRIDSGSDKLACVRLSERGLLRFYTGCCRTPIGNTMARARAPLFVIVRPLMQPGEGRTLDQVLGPVGLYLQAKSATGPVQLDPAAPSAFRAGTRLAVNIVKGLLLGKHKPSVFFDSDGKQLLTPEILTPERHQSLRTGAAAH